MSIVFMTWSKRLKRGSLRAAGTPTIRPDLKAGPAPFDTSATFNSRQGHN